MSRPLAPAHGQQFRSAKLPPAILTEVTMRLIGLTVVLAVSISLAPLAAEAQPTGKGRSHRVSSDGPGGCLQHDRGLPWRTA